MQARNGPQKSSVTVPLKSSFSFSYVRWSELYLFLMVVLFRPDAYLPIELGIFRPVPIKQNTQKTGTKCFFYYTNQPIIILDYNF